MAETTFQIGNYSAVKVRLEPTEVYGSGNSTSPILTLQFKIQLSSISAQPPIEYTMIRLAGRLKIGNPAEQVATFEAPPMAEGSSIQGYERQFQVDVPLGIRETKRIEDLRDGKNPFFRISLSGLVHVHNKGFELLRESAIDIIVPRSHWIDHVLNVWGTSDLQLLEIRMPSTTRKEFATMQERLAKAEQLYRVGDYSHVLTSLRLAFEAFAEVYGASRADRNFFDKMLADNHPEMREKLRDTFDYIYRLLNAGPHEPTPTANQQLPINRNEARFALVTAYAVFEYFSGNGWRDL
jgi:hypothetical protein